MASSLVASSRLLLAAGGVTLFALAGYVRVSRGRPAASSFTLLLGVLGASALGTSAAAASPAANKYVWLLAYLLIPVALALFAFDYYGLSYLGDRYRLGAFLAPVALSTVGGAVVIFGTPAYSADAVAPVAALAGLPEAVYPFARLLKRLGVYYAGGVALVATGLVLSTVVSYEQLSARLGVTLSLVGVWPWVVYLGMPAVTPVVGADVILGALAAGFLASIGVAALALWRYRLFDAAPAAANLGPESVLESMTDAVVVVDGEERVVRLNPAARRTFGVEQTGVVGEPLRVLVDADLDTLAAADAFELDTAEGSRRFEATVSGMTDRRGRAVGHAVVLRDVTERRTRRQRLAVLNRLLRHNLRNDMSVIIGRAEAIADDQGVEPATVAEGILTAADDLVSLGERAREVERMMSVPDRLDPEASVPAVVERVLRPAPDDRGWDDVTVRTDLDRVAVAADPELLAPVLDNLVRNAVEHNDADDPEVEVTASVDPSRDTVEITVADNGPGIPETERRVIEKGVEEALEHGSGLGLWGVKWGVTRMGGDLSFEANEPRGTVVRVRLPVASERAASAGTAREVATPEAVADGGRRER